MSTRARIEFHVQPRASKTEIVGLHDGRVRVRLAAPPVDNAANDALIAFVAERLGVARRQVAVAQRVIAPRMSRATISLRKRLQMPPCM